MKSKPNILIILSDQLRRHALGCYGDSTAKTSNIDALAARGVQFDNACSSYPVCVPFRFTFMTGIPAHSRLVPAIEWRMAPTERTLADEFNEQGYETFYIGKWHLDGGHGRMGSALQTGRTPVRKVNQGRWQRWSGFELRNDPYDTYYFRDDDPVPRPIEGYQTDGLFDIAMDYLATRDESSRPFCLVLSVEPPHPPFVAPPELERAWLAREISLPENFVDTPGELRDQFIRDRRIYAAMVENLDINIGRLQSFLADHRLADSTVQLLFSDHGEMNGAHGLREKQNPYEESIGIPFIVHDPRVSHSGRTRIPDPIHTEDIFPTVIGLAGFSPRDSVPGIDLTPLIHGRIPRLDRFGVPLEFVAEMRRGAPFHEAVWRGFRSERYKYTVTGDKNGARPWQFFDLAADPCELHNLVDDPAYLQQITAHHVALRSAIAGSDDQFPLEPAYGIEGINMWQAP